MKTIFLTMVAFVTLSNLALAAPRQKVGHPVEKKMVLICPVTGDKIASVKASVGHSVYKGKTYYFCCAGCKPSFDKNPDKYLTGLDDRIKAAQKKGDK